LSGNHKAVARFRRKSALKKTAQMRPDLLRREDIAQDLSEEEQDYVANMRSQSDDAQ